MNILIINYEYPPLGGGGGVVSKMLAEALVDRHQITVLTSRFGEQPLQETVNGVELLRVPIPFRSDRNAASLFSMLAFFPCSLWVGIKLLRRRKFDLIHSMFAIPSAPSGLLLSKLFKKPHLLSIFGGDIYDPEKKLSPHQTPVLRQTVSWTLQASESVVAISEDIRKRAYHYYSLQEEKISLIRQGIPRPEFTSIERKAHGFAEEDILLITIGRLVKRKAVHELIHILKKLDDPRVKLLIIGDGPERESLEEIRAKTNLDKQIFFLGNVDDNDKFALVNCSDIYVSTSQHEGYGLVFLEAMLLGLPIISYDNGGQTDFLQDGETGYLVQLGSQDIFAERLRVLVADSALRSAMREFNFQHRHQFFIKSTARKYEEEYLKLTA